MSVNGCNEIFRHEDQASERRIIDQNKLCVCNFHFKNCYLCPHYLKEDKGKFILTRFPLRFHRKINLDTAKRHILEALLEQLPPIFTENQLQDISHSSFGLPSIETIDGLHVSVEYDGLHGSVEPIKGLPRGYVFSAVDSMSSNNSKKKHQKLSYSEIMREMKAFSSVTSKKT